MIKRQLEYIYYWRTYISDVELQQWLDKLKLYDRDCWLLLLDEKLRRVEHEIYIKEL